MSSVHKPRIIWNNEAEFAKAKQEAAAKNLPLQLADGSLNPDVFGNYKMEFTIADYVDGKHVGDLGSAYVSDFSAFSIS